MRKINNNNKYCNLCKNKDKDKIEKQIEFMKENAHKIINGIKFKEEKIKKTINDMIINSCNNWENESDEYKTKYELIYITDNEFTLIKDKIKSINNDMIILNDDWKYMYNYICHNQQKYNPVFINIKNNCVVKPYYIKFNCENCGEDFITKDISTHKNRIKILCKNCSFCNRVFKIKIATILGNKIKYNSNYEKRFIDWCSDNNLKIKNGPVIEYIWKDKKHKYYVDFEIIDKNIILEFKDNHIWHQQQTENGKFDQKNKYTNEWCKKNNYIFKIIFPKNLSDIKKQILSL